MKSNFKTDLFKGSICINTLDPENLPKPIKAFKQIIRTVNMSKRKRDNIEDFEQLKHVEDDESDDDSDIEIPSTASIVGKSPVYGNKQRVLIISSRGITARYRHLLEDFKKLIPHHKKDNKLDSKNEIHAVNEIAEIKGCNQVIYFETRKRQDLYMYLGKSPQGPSVKFQVVNIHTMDELKLTGNCMIGSRPLLNFDAHFESSPHWKLLKLLLSDSFGTPFGHPKSKPFVDRIMSFIIIKNNICKYIWIKSTLFRFLKLFLGVRNYQIVDKNDRADGKETNLIEIGPRFVLTPIRVFNGSLYGATLYQNSSYVSPNEQRAEINRGKG